MIKRKRNVTLTVRMTEDEKEWIARTAKLKHKTLTDLILISVCRQKVTNEYGTILRELKNIEQILKNIEDSTNAGDIYEATQILNHAYKNIMQSICKERNI